MWNGKTLAVILPTYRERPTIRGVIERIEALGFVDDVVVVNNNAEVGTSDEVGRTEAREVVETRQGYGAAIRKGISSTRADLVCVIEPDGTFDPEDLLKLLAYTGDFDFVFGSRTSRDLIWTGANMGNFLRWGNWAVAKLVELLFNSNSLSDIGCTLRVVDGPALRAMQAQFTVDGGAFGPEMMLLALIGRWRIVQLPVNYHARGGRAGTTESFLKAARIGVEMIALVTRYRTRSNAVRRALASAGAVRIEHDDAPRPGGEPQHMLTRRLRESVPRRGSRG